MIIDPKNSLAKYKKAAVLVNLGRYDVRAFVFYWVPRVNSRAFDSRALYDVRRCCSVAFNFFVACSRVQDALEELEKLQDCAPREASLYYLMGKVLKKKGETSKALDCFTMALDFDTKSALATNIKTAINKLGIPDEDDDIEDDKDEEEDFVKEI